MDWITDHDRALIHAISKITTRHIDQARGRAFRRHQANRHMRRRLKEDRNQHYEQLDCPCWDNEKVMARFKEQPKLCSCWMCGNQRRWHGPNAQEWREQCRTQLDLKEEGLD